MLRATSARWATAASRTTEAYRIGGKNQGMPRTGPGAESLYTLVEVKTAARDIRTMLKRVRVRALVSMKYDANITPEWRAAPLKARIAGVTLCSCLAACPPNIW